MTQPDLSETSASTSFPKTIWQTYRTRDLPPAAKLCIRSWRQKNPGWAVEFRDDAEIERFVREHLGAAAGEIFRSLPLGAMKADLWRYAVMHKHGGVYADLDTICRHPAKDWCTAPKGLLVGVENTTGVHFCQWAFAARPGHPVLERVIDLVLARAASGIDPQRPHYVHYHTGPAVWSDAIRSYLGLVTCSDTPGRAANTPLARDIFLDVDLWREADIVLLPETAFNGGLVDHLSASARWRDHAGYDSWVAKRFAV